MPEPRPAVSPIQPRRSGSSLQRVGDLERSAVCDELSAQFAAGRLVPEELEERLSLAVEARTRADLGVLLVDLPASESAASAAEPQPAVPLPVPPAIAWNALDILALLAMLGSFAIAAIGLLGVIAAGEPSYGWVAFLATVVAAVGAASATHLVHRGRARYDARLRAAANTIPPR
jgi:hypothetical protein